MRNNREEKWPYGRDLPSTTQLLAITGSLRLKEDVRINSGLWNLAAKVLAA